MPEHLTHLTHLLRLTCLLIWPTIILRAAENCVRAYSSAGWDCDSTTSADTVVVGAALFI